MLALLGLSDVENGITLFTVMLATSVASWLWVGGVVLWVRFRTGGDVEGPTGSWSCPNCRSVNQSYALKCDSCGQAYAAGRGV